jgi:hypothetical protein
VSVWDSEVFRFVFLFGFRGKLTSFLSFRALVSGVSTAAVGNFVVGVVGVVLSVGCSRSGLVESEDVILADCSMVWVTYYWLGGLLDCGVVQVGNQWYLQLPMWGISEFSGLPRKGSRPLMSMQGHRWLFRGSI